MAALRKIAVSTGMFWIEAPAADIRILCGCPVDSVKHLLRRGLIVSTEVNGVECETGPNAILLSDLAIQNGRACNRSEFPVLQMLYKQGLIVPDHPCNTGLRPLLIGSGSQIEAQMEYLFRGNYGLASREELIQAGADPAQADELMRMKLAFAFGRIMPTDELIEPRVVAREPVEIRDGLTIRRLRTNVFEFSYQGERVEVDLNLGPGEVYECPYTLDRHLLKRDYFSVVHSGEGDGWDMNRPTMGSILLFQGRVYLIDAGPNIDYTLMALGISVNEIDGVFHTHCHDDHLAGLTMLIRGDRRITYFATPMVRASVTKKLSSVMRIPESEFGKLFDVRDLAMDEWNDIEGLEVRPILSPHPVETTVFYFRVMWEGGYRSYAHLADIVSLSVLRDMIAPEDAIAGVSEAFYAKIAAAYAIDANVKKIDIGGGMIHGVASDFRDDSSGKLILAHTARKFTEDERAIGSGAPFGTVDVLIEGTSDTLRRRAFEYLRSYFPEASLHSIRHLMNGNILVFNPEAQLFKEQAPVDAVYLILSGSAELLRTGQRGSSMVSAGSILGETAALNGIAEKETCRAISFVQALRISRDLYLDFVTRGAIRHDLVESRENLDFLRGNWLFADGVSCVTLSGLLRSAGSAVFKKDRIIPPPADELLVLRSGEAAIATPSGYAEGIPVGGYVGATAISRDESKGAQLRFLSLTEAYSFPLDTIANIPVVRWKLLETHRRRYVDN
ncbi:MAG: cyclic nucleotide-binding domain-containing protein [Burkholderiales bacterium]|nr:cyclic nucleotide-binding domain-containing protein [Burkholderiales bacterium]